VWTVTGDWDSNGATLTDDSMWLKLQNPSTGTFRTTTTTGLMSIEFAGSYSTYRNHGSYEVIVGNGCTVTITTGVYLGCRWYSNAYSNYSNLGTISTVGTGYFSLWVLDVTRTNIVIGNVGNFNLWGHTSMAANRTWTLGAHTTISGYFLMDASNATYKPTLDLNGYNLTVTSNVTVQDAATLMGGEGTITVSGNWDTSAGKFTAETSTLKMDSGGRTIKSNGAYANGHLYSLEFNGTGTITLLSNYWMDMGGTFTNNGMTLALGNYFFFVYPRNGGNCFSGTGTISTAGSGYLGLSYAGDSVLSTTGWTINAPVRIEAGGTDRILTLTSALTVGGNLFIYTSGTGYVDADTYNVSCVNFSFDTSGIFKAGDATTHTISGNWDTSAGTFTRETSLVKMTGTSKTITTNTTDACTGGFYDITIDTGASYTLQSNAWYWGTKTETGTLTLNGYTISKCSSGTTWEYYETVHITDSFVRNKTLPYSQPVTVANSYVRDKTLPFTQLVQVTDSFLRNKTLPFSQAVQVATSFVRNKSLPYSQLVQVADSIIRNKTIPFSQSVHISDGSLVNKTLKFADTLHITDSWVRNKTIPFSQLVQISDSWTRQATFVKTFADTIHLADSFKTNKTLAFTQPVQVADSSKTNKTLVYGQLVTIATSALRNKSLPYAQSIAVQDVLLRNKSLPYSQAVQIADAFKTNKTLLFAQPVSIATTTLRNKTIPYTQAVTVTDAQKMLQWVIHYTQGIAVSDEADITVGSKFIEYVESIHITDSAVRNKTLAYAQPVTVADTRLVNKTLLFGQALHITDSVLRNKTLPYTQAVHLADTVLRNKTLPYAQTVSIADSKLVNKTLRFTQAVQIADLFDLGGSLIYKTWSETIHITDAVVRNKSIPYAQPVTVSDSIIRNKTIPYSQAVQVADSLIRNRTLLYTQNVTIADSKAVNKTLRFAQAISITDGVLWGASVQVPIEGSGNAASPSGLAKKLSETMIGNKYGYSGRGHI